MSPKRRVTLRISSRAIAGTDKARILKQMPQRNPRLWKHKRRPEGRLLKRADAQSDPAGGLDQK